MRIGSLFTGYGGLNMAAEEVFSGHTVWTSDIDPGACKIIAHRMPQAPNLGDITAIDWTAVEPVDVLTGGFPCQDLSHAGKRAGMRPDTRSGLWTHMAYAINQLRPRYVVAENVRGLLSASANSDLEPCPWCLGGATDGEPVLRALGAVLGDLAELGYDAQWTGIRAADVGAPHARFRVFVLAHDAGIPRRPASAGDLPPRPGARAEPRERPRIDHAGGEVRGPVEWGPYDTAVRRWGRVLGRSAPVPTEPSHLGPVISARFAEWLMGLPDGWVTDVPDLDKDAQLKALGNGVVPQQAVAALRLMLDQQAVA